MEQRIDIVDISVDNISQYVNDISALFANAGWSSDKQKIISLLKLRNSRAKCAVHNGHVVGFIYYILYSNSAWSGYINVHRKMRRRGIATKLKQQMIQDCKNKQIKQIRLITSWELISLNSALGFSVERDVINLSLRGCVNQCVRQMSSDPIDIHKILCFDNLYFEGDRSERIKEHIACHPDLIWADIQNGRIVGYALAWEYPNSVRIGPIVHIGHTIDEFLDRVVSDLEKRYSEIDVLVYKDDIHSYSFFKKRGFIETKHEFQLCISFGNYHRQHRAIKSVWGRATG